MLPPYLQHGAKGLILAATFAFIPWWVRREMAREPTGAKTHPYPPHGGAPPSSLFVATEYLPWDADAFDQALQAAAPLLSPGARDILTVHAKIASRRGGIPNGNPFRIVAPKGTHHRWTALPVQEWDGAPIWRWVPVFAYLSVHAGIRAYVQGLAPQAVIALNNGDAENYVRELGVYGHSIAPALANELERA